MKTPIIKGGQGRTPQDIEESALTLLWFGAILLVLISYLLFAG